MRTRPPRWRPRKRSQVTLFVMQEGVVSGSASEALRNFAVLAQGHSEGIVDVDLVLGWRRYSVDDIVELNVDVKAAGQALLRTLEQPIPH